MKSVFVKNINIVRPELDGDEAVLSSASVFVRDGVIAAVNAPSREKEADIILDGTGKWMVPGFVDSHVHFFQSGNPYTRPDTIDLTKLVPYEKENARNHARLSATFRTWLASGVTGVMDMGGPFWNFRVREEASRTEYSPRVLVTGPLFSMVEDRPLELDDPPMIKVAFSNEVRELAEKQLKQNPDYLKVWFIHRKGDDLSKQEEIVKEVGGIAHGAGIRLAVHATELETAKAALRAGADILVHSVGDQPVDNEFLRLAKERNVIYIPTLYVPRGYAEVFSRNWRPTGAEEKLADPEVLAHMRDIETLSESDIPEKNLPLFRLKGESLPPETLARLKTSEINLMRVCNSGITIALGTDAGNIGTLHGPSVFREMQIMVNAGMSTAQVLRCATTNGAEAMGLKDETGRVEESYSADLVILNSNPLEKIENAGDISHVICKGRLFSEEELISGR